MASFNPETLIFYRGLKGLSQYDLAELTGISQTSISKLESGRTSPRKSTLARIANALGRSPDDFSVKTDTLHPMSINLQNGKVFSFELKGEQYEAVQSLVSELGITEEAAIGMMLRLAMKSMRDQGSEIVGDHPFLGQILKSRDRLREEAEQKQSKEEAK